MDFFIIIWAIALVHTFFKYLPDIVRSLGALVVFLLLCFWESGKLFARAALWLTARSAQGAYWAARKISLFTRILIDELRRGPEEEEPGDWADTEEEPVTAPAQDAYATALLIFGLAEPFTAADLKRAYRQLMKAAHTDVGGTKEMAQAVNAARDHLMAVKGWT